MITVIIILALLSVIAIPKFIDLNSEAESATVNGLKGALITASRLVHAKAVIDKLDEGNNILTFNGGDISIRAGYPRVANSCSTFTNQLNHWLSADIDATICAGGNNADWFGVVEDNLFHFMPAKYTSTAQNCYVTYTTASEFVPGSGWVDKEFAEITSTTSGCSS